MITGVTRVAGVIGDPVRHSLSPRLHNAAYRVLGLDWVFMAFEVPDGRAPAALDAARELGFVGLAVTMPHKHDAALGVDECTDVAARLGVVNCITRKAGRLVGDSTDGAGFVESLRRGAGFDPAGRKCLVVGAGGAARAVVMALADGGADEVVVVNRTGVRAAEAAALAGGAGRVGSTADISGAELVVQATSVGMAGIDRSGDGGISVPFDPALLHAGQLVADLVYHPAVTPLLAAAEAAGAQTVGGLGMLVHQAALAVERWTQQTAPVDAMWAAAKRSTPTG